MTQEVSSSKVGVWDGPLEGEVECDEVYVVAGHKGHPEAVKKKGGPPAEGA